MSQTSQYSPQERRQASSFNTNGRATYASGAPSFAQVDNLPRPLEMDVNVPRTLGGMQTPSANSFSNIPGLGPLNRLHRSHPGSLSDSSRVGNPLKDWYNSNSKEDPWTARIIGASQGKNKESVVNLRKTGPLPSYVQYPGTPAQSDYGTSPGGVPQSDSGYGTAHIPSVGNPSVFEDSTETHSLIGNQPDLPYSSSLNRDGYPPNDFSPSPWNQSNALQPSALSSNTGKAHLFCADCNKFVKTNSELTKHKARHSLPYRCTEPGCSRSEKGFSTSNDLARHRRSCHHDTSAPGARYKCTEGICANKDKLWPRADNFKQHLSRVHKVPLTKDLDLDRYKEPQPNPDLAGLVMSETDTVSGMIHPYWVPDMGSMDDSPSFDDGPMTSLDSLQFQHHAYFMSESLELVPSAHSNQPQDLDEDRRPHPALSMALRQQPVEISQSARPNTEECRIQRDGMEMDSHDPCIESHILDDETPSQQSLQEAANDISGSPMEIDSHDSPPATGSHGGTPEPRPTSENHSVDQMMEDRHSDIARDLDDKGSPEAASPASETSDSLPSPENSVEFKEDDVQRNPSPDLRHERTVDVMTEGEASEMVKRLKESGMLDKVLEPLGYQKAKGIGTKPRKATNTPQAATETQQHRCPQCGKGFNRLCELKKHKKRHDKPYGCTFPQCTKSFGSKNDWKRHENSQHFQAEMWKCDEKLKEDGPELCGKTCHRRETFRYHLDKDHSIGDPKVVDQKLDKCHVGSNAETRFWCGFCTKIIESSHPEKFNHIDAHYTGRNGFVKREKSEWKDMDGGFPEMDLTSERRDNIQSKSVQSGGGQNSAAPKTVDEPRQKRNREGEPIQREKKRPKTEPKQQDMDWFCCHCKNMWAWDVTKVCMGVDGPCGHKACQGCNWQEKLKEIPLS